MSDEYKQSKYVQRIVDQNDACEEKILEWEVQESPRNEAKSRKEADFKAKVVPSAIPQDFASFYRESDNLTTPVIFEKFEHVYMNSWKTEQVRQISLIVYPGEKSTLSAESIFGPNSRVDSQELLQAIFAYYMV